MKNSFKEAANKASQARSITKGRKSRSEQILRLAEFGFEDIPEFAALIADGFDALVTDKNGLTALHHAAKHGQSGIAMVLVGQGADINAKDNQGHTPLHLAALNGWPETAATLIEFGADTSKRDRQGYTPYQLGASVNNMVSAAMITDTISLRHTRHIKAIGHRRAKSAPR